MDAQLLQDSGGVGQHQAVDKEHKERGLVQPVEEPPEQRAAVLQGGAQLHQQVNGQEVGEGLHQLQVKKYHPGGKFQIAQAQIGQHHQP